MYEVEKKRKDFENKIANLSRRLQKDGISLLQINEMMEERKALLSIIQVLVDIMNNQKKSKPSAQLDLFEKMGWSC